MKIILSFILIINISTLSFSQDTLKVSDIEKFTYNFIISNNKLIGEGADTLSRRISESQFVMLGEQHFVSEISILTNALLPILSKSDYKYFMAEIGPNSAKKLVAQIESNAQLNDFNTKYFKQCGEIPIPFFDGVEDETFLKTAINNKFEILGIDQEYMSSQFFLFDEIFKLSKNKNEIEPKYSKAYSFALNEFKKYWNDESYKIFDNYLNSKEISDFFNNTDQKNIEIQKIITDLKKSWYIYALNDKEMYRKNWLNRIENMKSNFGKTYKSISKSDSIPKIFIKMGAVHLSNGLNSFGYYDIGNMIKELANFNQTKATSIQCLPRFYEENNKIVDDLNETDILYPILINAKQSEWALFDTNNFIDYCYKMNIKLSAELKTELNRYDFILIPPVVHNMKNNYKD
jgi:hypothetical protein